MPCLRAWLAVFLLLLSPGLPGPAAIAQADAAAMVARGDICLAPGTGDHGGAPPANGVDDCRQTCCLGAAPLPPLPAAPVPPSLRAERGEALPIPYRLSQRPLAQACAIRPRGPPPAALTV